MGCDVKTAFRFDSTLFQHYRALIGVRASHPAVRRGGFQSILTDDARDVYAFARRDGRDAVLVVMNNNDAEQTVMLPRGGLLHRRWRRAFGEGTAQTVGGGLRCVLPGRSGLILEAVP